MKPATWRKHDHPTHWTKALALEHLRIRHDRYFHAIPDLDELLQVHCVLHELEVGA